MGGSGLLPYNTSRNPVPPVANPCCNPFAWRGSELRVGDAAARFNQRNCRLDCMAARGTGAAERTHAAHRRTDEYRGGRSRSAGNGGSILSRISRSGLDHRPQCADRLSMVSRQRRNRSNGAAIVTGSAIYTVHRDLILKLIDRYRLPAIYGDRVSVANGGLMSYGPDRADMCRRAAGYVDRHSQR